jgi:hypothetical protein
MTATSRPIECCKVCNSKHLDSVLFVGYIPPVNTMPAIGSVPVEEPAYPLEMLRCSDCGLVQIGLEVAPEVLFPESYPYLSGSTRILRSNFADLRVESENLLKLSKNKRVIDIGSNDGTLLSNFHDAGYPVLGIEPSQAADVAMSRGIDTLKTYFNRDIARKLAAERGKAQLITAANVFAHIGDIHSTVDGIVELLDENGTFVSESHYLLDLVNTVQYDTIYHEHLRYYSLGSLQYLLTAHGLEVFHIKRIPTHGGSIRVYSARKGQREILPSVKEQLAEEDRRGITDGSGLKGFRQRVIRSKIELYELIAPLKRAGARIFGIGAPSRASTLINYVGIDDGILDAVMEVSSSHKLNKYVSGTRIPVLDESLLFKEQPEYALLLSWHIAEELATNLRAGGYRGKFITPLPEPRILDV